MIEWNQERVGQFFSYARERQEIWYKRYVLKQPPPWTDDPILRAYSFCENFRQLDRGTKYAIENILTLPAPEDRVFVTMFYRLFNNPTTMDRLGIKNIAAFDRKAIQKDLLGMQRAGEKVFRAAYMTSAITTSGPGGKIKEYCRVLFKAHIQRIKLTAYLKDAPNMEAAWDLVKEVRWFGPFIAYQVVLDLNYDPYFHWPEADWVYCGPGAQRGLNWLLKEPLKKQNDLIAAINQLTELQTSYLRGFKYPPGISKLSNHDCEFICCEFLKWTRIQNGGKKTRRFEGGQTSE